MYPVKHFVLIFRTTFKETHISTVCIHQRQASRGQHHLLLHLEQQNNHHLTNQERTPRRMSFLLPVL